MGRLEVYSTLSVALAIAVVYNAWNQKRQFYHVFVYLSSNNINVLVMMNLILVIAIAWGRIIKQFFFGQLRPMEVESLYERGWYTLSETTLAMTIFRNEFDVKFALHFGNLLFYKTFHWILQDRVNFMEQLPNPGLQFHYKMCSLFAGLLMIDVALLSYSIYTIATEGAGMMIIFGFEHMLLIVTLISTFFKYVLHTIDLRREEPWEDKSMYIFYLDLVADFLKLVTYIAFFAAIIHFYGFPLHILRDLYVTMRSFYQRCKDLIQYRRATLNMNDRYPCPTQEQLDATDKVCIICRDDMVLVPVAGGVVNPSTPKQLPCGHIFHLRCLRNWLERQQACPTCRRSVLEPAPVRPAAAIIQEPRLPIQPPLHQAQQALPGHSHLEIHQQHAIQQAQVFHANADNSTNAGSSQQNSLGATQFPTLYPLIPITLNPLLANHPAMVRDHLSDEELARLEGDTREAILARLVALHEVQHQLTGIITQLTQIYAMMPERPLSEQTNVNQQQ